MCLCISNLLATLVDTAGKYSYSLTQSDSAVRGMSCLPRCVSLASCSGSAFPLEAFAIPLFHTCMRLRAWASQQLREAPVAFLPTYKKADGRPPLDTNDPNWVLKEYQIKMKKGVLGQKKTVERPPSVRPVTSRNPKPLDYLYCPLPLPVLDPKPCWVLLHALHVPFCCMPMRG